MNVLDTNVFLRFLTRDDEVKARACYDLFTQLSNGQAQATTSEAVLAEIVFVLRSRRHYGLSPEEIGARLRPILELSGLKVTNKRVFLRALDIFEDFPFLDFEDALTVAYLEHDASSTLVCYDTDFDRLPGIARVEP